MNSMVSKLRALKSIVLIWERDKKKILGEELKIFEGELETIYLYNTCGIMSEQVKAWVKELEAQKLEFLKIEEETWRQKNHAIWLAKVEQNAKKISSFCRSKKSS